MALFGKRLAGLREERSLTQQEMADRLGITRQAYGNYESGKREPDYKTLIWLSEFFDVQTDYLLGTSTERRHIDGKSSESGLLARYAALLRRADELGVSISFYGGPGDEITEERITGWEADLDEFETIRAQMRKKRK